jgi:hypothetical protein
MLYCIIVELPVNITGKYYENFNAQPDNAANPNLQIQFSGFDKLSMGNIPKVKGLLGYLQCTLNLIKSDTCNLSSVDNTRGALCACLSFPYGECCFDTPADALPACSVYW